MNALGAELETRLVHRLALGLEPLDAARGGRLHYPVRMDVEGKLPWAPGAPGDARRPYRRAMRRGDVRPSISRNNTGRHVLLYHPALASRIDVRIYDHERRYAPRRFRIPLVSLDDVLDAEEAGAPLPAGSRIRRPVLFPGAAYEVGELATGLRGRVLRDNRPMRWARVDAFLDTATGPLVGRAHGDDRGEFLLLLSPRAAPGAELPEVLNVRVMIYGPKDASTPTSPSLPQEDAWWELPLEQLPPAGAPDPVSAGEILPSHPSLYVEGSRRVISFRYSHILTRSDGITDFDFVPAP